MVKEKNRRLGKGLAIVLEQLAAMVLVVCLFICFSYLSSSGGGSNDVGKKVEFRESQSYINVIQGQIYNLGSYVHLSEKFETDGVFDEDIIVDIKEYAKYGIVGDRVQNGIGYRLGDLLSWTQEGVFYETRRIVNETVMETIVEEDDYERIWYEGEEIEAVIETFPPIGEESIMDYYLASPDTSLSDWYYYLSLTLNNIRSEVNNYKRMRDVMSSENSNMLYLITNLTTGEEYGNSNYSARQLEMRDDYITMDLSSYSISSNLNISKESMYDLMENLTKEIGYNFSLTVGINSDFPIEDQFAEAQTLYHKWQPLYFGATVAALIASIVVLICFIYLTIVSGREHDGAEIQLHVIDRLKTEPAFILYFTIFSVFMVFFVTEVEILQEGSVAFLSVIIGAMTLILNSIALIGYLSLVRRIKAGTLWKNSVTAYFVRLFQTVLKNSKITRKTIFLYIIFLIANFFLFLLNGPGIFLAMILDCIVGFALVRDAIGRRQVLEGAKEVASGNLQYKIHLMPLRGDNFVLAESINNIGEGLQNAVDKSVKSERLKTDLITNVSHDIKTPLTSIINYVDLMKREDIENEKVKGYLEVLERKSHRLKNLTEDLVEASKISSGNIKLEFTNINFKELINQTNGEFDEKFAAKDLELVTNLPDRDVTIRADGRRIWRVIENLYNNVAKYAMPGTRVYVDVVVSDFRMYFSVKNISEQPLNIKASELTERFIRGDVSRSTEGSGLGLSIAQNLTKLQNGNFEIYLDGDLFKVVVDFPTVTKKMEADS